MIIYCCKDCGTQINYNTALYGEGRCYSCSNKNRWKNKNYNLKVSKKISLSKQGKWKGKDNPFFNKHRNGKLNPMFGVHRFGKEAAHWQGGKPICKDCGKQLKYYNTKKCQPCYTKLLKGINSPSYIHGQGKFPYPMDFNENLKCKIRDRDNHTCQICDVIEKKLNVKLSIHHIDYNKENCKEDNLISLCLKCHLKTNGNKELDRDYWFAYCTYLMENKKEN
jgi:hypothetical protein